MKSLLKFSGVILCVSVCFLCSFILISDLVPETPVESVETPDENFIVDPVFDPRLRGSVSTMQLISAPSRDRPYNPNSIRPVQPRVMKPNPKPFYPALKFGQVVTLNSDFFDNVKAVVVARVRPGLYVVAPMEGPVTNQRIDSRITLPVERETNE